MRCVPAGRIAGLLILGLVGCGTPQDDTHDAGGSSATGALALTTEASAWQSSLPAGTGSLTPVRTISVRGCDFAVGTAILTPPPAPGPTVPLNLAYVQRGVGRHGPRWCTPGFVAYGASVMPGVQVDVAARPGKPVLVLDYTYTLTYEGGWQLGIVELDATSGEMLCITGLRALRSTPGTGNITSGTLALDPHGTLTVTGTKDGTIPGETGSGPSYVATWSHFLGAAECPTAPTSVVAF